MAKITSGENKRAHLQMIQGVINRMASNQFLFKGWSITLIAGIATFSAKDNNPALMAIPVAATLLFWAVDAYYLMLERAFRDLYDSVSKKDESKIDFKMDIKNRGIRAGDWVKTIRSRTLAGFYGSVFVALLVLVAILNNFWVEVILHHGTQSIR